MSMEIQIYLAKFLPVPRRGEPRNVGLVVRTANDEIFTKFLFEGEKTCVSPKSLDLKEFASVVVDWKIAIQKYGVKALHWVGKRKKYDQRFYIEFVGGEFVQEFDIDKFYEELVA